MPASASPWRSGSACRSWSAACSPAAASGWTTPRIFLAPTLRALLPDPGVLADMAPASARLAKAVRAGETVAVFGDYDVDGACSGALAALVLGELGCPILSYVPDRLAEGYGPNLPALRGLIARGARLLLCVDCGHLRATRVRRNSRAPASTSSCSTTTPRRRCRAPPSPR